MLTLDLISQAKLTGLNFMAVLTVRTGSALKEAGNSVLFVKCILRVSWDFGLCACVLLVTRLSTLTQLAQTFGA